MPDHIHGLLSIREKLFEDVQREQFGKAAFKSLTAKWKHFMRAVTGLVLRIWGGPDAEVWMRRYFRKLAQGGMG